MKRYFSILAAVVALLTISGQKARANDYLEEKGHYTVMSMGNGVLRFKVPVWVYGRANDYYLESSKERNKNDDSYVWFSLEPNAKRGESGIHRIATVAAVRYGKNDTDGEEGEGYIYVHEGSIKIQNEYTGKTIVITEGDDTYWKSGTALSLKRLMYDDDHKRITHITFDWYPPTYLQEKEFYWGVSANIYKKSSGESSYKKWWSWPERFIGGNMPQSPELYQPYIYAMNENGTTGYGCAAIQYAVYQQPISYHTSLDPTEVRTSDRANQIIVPTTDSVQRFFSATFHVWLDSTAKVDQYLQTNELHIPAYHRLYNLRGEQELDEKGSVTGKVKLMWEVNNADAEDLVPGDMFEVQRATDPNFADAETFEVVPMVSGSAVYSVEDNPLQALGPDTNKTATEGHYERIARQVTTYDENGDPFAVYDVTMYTQRVLKPGRTVYYRVRRASAAVWGWAHDFAKTDTMLSKNYLAPLSDEQADYTLDADFATNRKVHFSFQLDNNTIAPIPESEEECKFTCQLNKLTPAQMPIRIRVRNTSTTFMKPEWYRYIFSYTMPESSERIRVELPVTMLGKYYNASFPSEAENLQFEVRRRSDGYAWYNTPSKGVPYVKEIRFNGPEFSEFGVPAGGVYEQLTDSLKNAHPLNKDSVRHALYQDLVAQIEAVSEEGNPRCNWDKNATLYLQRILVETGDTVELPIPADSIVRQEDGSWRVHMTDVADVPCVHYQYGVRLDQTYSLLKVLNSQSLMPQAIHGPELYYAAAADIDSIHASQGDDRYGVLLIWIPTVGGADEYTIERRDHGSNGLFEPLLTTTETYYRDTSALPDKHYDYRITVTYTCNDSTMHHSAETEGWRSPYGMIKGRVHYEDGTACPGVSVKLTSEGMSELETVTDEFGRYAFDSLLYSLGLNYTITPTSQTAEFRFNNTSSGSATVSLSVKEPVLDGIEFDNISSVRLTGRVLYKHSSVPVRDASLVLNGHVVKTANGILHTDASGNFEMRVPKASGFTLRAEKEGHVFEDNGFIRIDGDSLITRTEPLDGVRIWDRTKVRLAGRVVGGRVQADMPLGFGLSTNNLGDDVQLVFELEGDNISWLVRDPEDLTRDTFEYAIPHTVYDAHGNPLAATDTTHMLYQKKRIIIQPDPKTGEFCADLFPVRYKITQATARGYATLFAKGKTSEVIDLSDAATRSGSERDANRTAQWNARYDLIYRSPISITCKQMRYGMIEDYFGERAYQRQNILNEIVSVPLAWLDADGNWQYLFGAPTFATGEYRFRITAHEDYYYNNDQQSAKHEEVRINGGKIKVYNGLHEDVNMQIITVPLDKTTTGDENRATFSLPLNEAGQADITIPVDNASFRKTGQNALRSLDISVEYENEYVEYQAFRGYIMGNKMKGNDFLNIIPGTVKLLDVLRDPPGSQSYAYIEKGTTYKYNYTSDFHVKFGVELGIRYGSSNILTMGVIAGAPGMYNGYVLNNSVTNNFAIPITTGYQNKNESYYSFTTTDRIETGSDNYYVGSRGDVYIGTTQSIFFGLLDAVKPIDSVTYASLAALLVDSVGVERSIRNVAEGRGPDGQKYYLVIGEELEAGSYVDGTFAYTADYIFNTLIPKLLRQRDALLLTGDSATVQAIANARKQVVYWTPLAPNSEQFALTDYRKLYPQETDSTIWMDVDEVKRYNEVIADWLKLIKDNEYAKLNIKPGANCELVDHYAISSGVKASHSDTYEYSSIDMEKMDGVSFSPNSAMFTNTVNKLMDKMSTEAWSLLNNIYQAVNNPDNHNSNQNPITVETKLPAATTEWVLNPVFDLDYERDPSTEVRGTKTAGYMLQTDDIAYMDVSVYRMVDKDNENEFNKQAQQTQDDVAGTGTGYSSGTYKYGSYIYKLNAGASRCPWEGPEESIFYSSGGQPALINPGTLKLENPTLTLDKHERSDVPHDKPAVFHLTIANEAEQFLGYTPVTMKLMLEEASNPKGAKVLLDGMPLTGEGREVLFIDANIYNKTLEVYAGEDYDYEDITVTLLSYCDYYTNARVSFSVHYTPVSCDVNISTPHDKWVMNTLSAQDSTGYYLPVVIDGFDVNYNNFDHIEFQYKQSKQGDDAWVNLCSYYASDSLYEAASGSKAKITSGRIENIHFYGERDPMEQEYDLRAVSFCRYGTGFVTKSSPVISGTKDTRPPVLFGAPQPANGILGVGDDMKLRFSEPIAGNYLDEDNNFQLIGMTNRTGITSSSSPHFNGGYGVYAATKVNRSLKDQNFSVDLVVKPDAQGQAESFFSHGDPGQGLVFGKTADNRLYVQMGNGLPYKSKVLDEPMTAFTRVILTYDQQDGFRFYAGTKDMTDEREAARSAGMPYPVSAPFVFGRGWQGNILEARIWTKALTSADIAETHMRYLTGYEKELLAYYRMNEGKGTVMTDLAHGATLYYDEADWSMPTGLSLKMAKDRQIELDNRYLGRSAIQDETILFWFRTTSAEGNLFSAGRIENDSVTAGFALRLENGTVALYSDRYKHTNALTVNDDAWHHLVLSVNRTYNSISLFIDEQLVDNFPSDEMGAVSGKMYLGGFDGHIDEFAIFEQALTKSLIESYSNITPYGDEMGLMAFLPFEKQKENNNGIIELIFSPDDERQFKDSEGNIVNKVLPLIITNDQSPITNLVDKTDYAPVRSRGLLSKMNFTWTYDRTELLLNLNMADREVNKQNIYITVRDVEDLNGNPMVSPVSWTVYADRNSLKWDKQSVTRKMIYGDPATDNGVDIILHNLSGVRHTYTVESLPEWLTVSRPTGAFDPVEDKTLRLTFSEDLPVGVYFDIVYLTDENGLSDPLRVEYTVEAVCPYDEPDRSLYPLNMSLCGQVKIGSDYDTDPNDRVIALFRNQCVGMATIDVSEQANTSKLFLSVYGSEAMEGKQIVFLLWQASTGKVLNLNADRTILFAHGAVYGCGDQTPVLFTSSGSETQNIPLNAGWTWISTNLQIANSQKLIANGQSPWTEGDLIKNPENRQFSTYSVVLDAFVGTLTGWDFRQMYMVYTANGNTLRLNGNTLPEDSMNIRLRGDGQWNAFPCLFNEAMPVTEAMSAYYDDAAPGDLIKSHDRFAVFSSDRRWEGDLTVLRPGEGYLFRRMGKGDVTVDFYKRKAQRLTTNDQRLTTNRPCPGLTTNDQWTNPRAATNMTMIAKVEGIEISRSRSLGVFVAGELVGVASPVTRNPSPVTEVLYFLTIQSDRVGTLRFETEDGESLEPFDVSKSRNIEISYIPDAHAGSLESPVILVPVTGNPSPLTRHPSPVTRKLIINDHVVIIRNGIRYDVTGKKLE